MSILVEMGNQQHTWMVIYFDLAIRFMGADVEELMLMEAIRRSLNDTPADVVSDIASNNQTSSQQSNPQPSPSVQSNPPMATSLGETSSPMGEDGQPNFHGEVISVNKNEQSILTTTDSLAGDDVEDTEIITQGVANVQVDTGNQDAGNGPELTKS